MRILDRYLLRGFLSPLFYCVLLFSILFIVVDSFNNLDEYLKHGVTLRIVLTYYLYLLPTILMQVAPVSILVAILYALGSLSRHNEIMALKAGGVSVLHILQPYLFMGVLMSFAIYLINEMLVPPTRVTSTAILEGLIQAGKKDLKERAIKNVTLAAPGHRMIFAREYEVLSQTLYDVVILEDKPNQYLKSKLVAKKAHYEKNRWVLEEAMKYEMNHRGDMTGEPVYNAKLELELPMRPEDFIKEASQVEFMSAKELRGYIESLGAGKRVVQRLWVDFHYKTAYPFVSFVVMLIGAPLAMRTARGSALMGIGIGFAVILVYYGLDSVCLALGKGGYLPPTAAAWAANLSFGTAGIYLIRKMS